MRKAFVLLLFPLLLAAQYRVGGGVQRPRSSSTPEVEPEDFASVEGQVVNAATGEPLRKAALRLSRTGGSSRSDTGPRAYTATSDSSGRYVISGVAPGQYRLSATRSGYVDTEYGARDPQQSGTVLSLGPKQRLSDVVVRMSPGAVIAGRILDEDGEPVAGVQVQAYRFRYTQGRKRAVEYGSDDTNDLGEYRIYGLAPGRYYLRAAARRGYGSDRTVRSAAQQQEPEYVATYYPGASDPAGAAPIEAGPGAQLRGFDLTLAKRHTVRVSGRISGGSTSGRQRMMVFLAAVQSQGFPSMYRASNIGPNGDFEIRGVLPGSYVLVAAVPDRDAPGMARVPVQVGNSDVENVAAAIAPPFALPGRVRVEEDAPANLSTVQVSLRTRDESFRGFGPEPLGRVKQDGTFSVANLAPDQYSVTVSGLPDGFYVKAVRAGERDALSAALDLTGGAPAPLDILLSPKAGQATGTVQNGSGQPAAGATVVLVPQEPERKDKPQYYRSVAADASGRFTLGSLDPGEYRIYAWPYVESGAWMDPDFLKPVESRGTSLSIREGSREDVQVRLIE